MIDEELSVMRRVDGRHTTRSFLKRSMVVGVKRAKVGVGGKRKRG